MSTFPRPPSHLTTLRHLFARDQWKATLQIAPQPSLRNSVLVGVQAAIAMAIVLPGVYLSPWSHLIGFAALGTLVAAYGRFCTTSGRSSRTPKFQAAYAPTAMKAPEPMEIWPQ